MKMHIITTWSGEQHLIDSETAIDLKEAWLGSEQSFPVELSEDRAISSSAIKSIEPKRYTEADLPTWNERPQLPAGNVCRGQYSIQNEIHRIALQEHPKEWASKVRDRKWREETRMKLRSIPGGMWCDYKAKECHCEPTFNPNFKRFSTTGATR